MGSFGAFARREVIAELRALPAQVRGAGATQRRLRALRTTADLRAAARRALPRAVFDFVDGAANDEVAMERNRRDLTALELHPRYLVDVSAIDTATTVLGTPVATPLLGAPTALSGIVDPGGEAALARAVHRHGSLYVLSGMATYALEEIARVAPGPRWLQLYVYRDRGFVDDLLTRAAETDYRALVVTVDAPRSGARERDARNGFGLPPRVTLRTLLDGARHPRWTAAFLRNPRLDPANAPLARGPGHPGNDPVALADFFASQFDAAVTWADLARLRDAWRGPLVVKGLLRADDARTAVAVGADAVWVSNHGGRQLDDAPSAISVLPRIADAVGDEAEIFFDSGIRRGSDAVKALALGARACFVARPLLYGLAVAGEQGVRHAFGLLQDELELTLALCGCASVADCANSGIVAASRAPAAVPDAGALPGWPGNEAVAGGRFPARRP